MAKQFTTPASSVVMGGMRTDDTPGYAKIIYQNRSLLTVPPVLAATFQGKQFFYSESFELTETTDTRDYVFKTPDTAEWAHFWVKAGGSAITEFRLWEDTELSVTTDYTALTTYNNNRNSTDVADCLLYLASADTTTDTGSRLWYLKSGSATQQSRDSSEGRIEDEMFLKRNSYYRISFATGSTSNFCHMRLHWHEHTNES